MQYMALLAGDESEFPEPGSDGMNALLAEYGAFGESAAEAIAAGDALAPTATAATIRTGDGGPLVTDGPFAEVTEAVGGFYVLEAETLDDAIDLARRIPAARDGWVAVRPLAGWWDHGAAADEAAAAAGDDTTGQDRFLALTYGKEGQAAVHGTPEWDEIAAAHWRFVEDNRPAVLAGGALHPVDTTTTVRVADGEVLVTDGPFTEAAEITGGFYVLRAADRDAAVRLASAIPTGPGGAVEVRPIRVFG
jgi:hypothetical protein